MGFKVIIVGGSVAGLSLANMLEQLNIDYTLLEAYPEIAPQVGASIGLLPNGFRILDQLGCYEPILDIAGDFHLKSSFRQSDGKAIVPPSSAATHHLERRTGYASIFIDRQMLLQVLYDNLKQKDRVVPEKRVNSIELIDGGVLVHTKDGSVYEGDIVVGADGIHSTVRQEMWRIGHQQSPGYFPQDEHSRVPVATRCIFGISKRPSNLPAGTQQMVHNMGWSYLIVGAPGNRTYWFLFEGVGETKYGKDIPRYTKEDTETLAMAHLKDPIYDNVTFGDIYKNRIMATLVPLEEYVFEKWHYKRIACIGDASHKIDPISGQGGNGAIEAAAILTNALTDMLERNPKSQSAAVVEEALAQVHANRHARAKDLVASGHQLQQVLTGRSPVSKPVINYLIPLMKEDGFLGTAVPICKASHHVHRLPMPNRPRLVPFDDELPARPLNNKTASKVVTLLAFGSLAALLARSGGLAHLSTLLDGFWSQARLASAGVSGVSLAQGFSGLPSIVSAGSLIQDVQFRSNLFSALAIWLAEGHRVGNRLSVLLWPSLSGAAFTAFGANAIMPLLGLGLVLRGSNALDGRHVPVDSAKSILPSVIAGYAIPTILAALPVRDPQLRQAVTLVASTAPIYCAALVNGISSVFQRVRDVIRPPKPAGEKGEVKLTEQEDFIAMYQKKDVAPLKLTYAFAAGVCATVHVVSIIYAWSGPGAASSPVAGGNALFGLASVAQTLYLAWTLRYEGFVTTKQAILGGLGSVASSLLVGPGAALSGFFYWREHVMSSLGN
ncbi:FAD binding domain-containing protein [Colletotrichum higginsianum]|uniref:FAD binding domain-containing protein n=1 Tax=Colletotrichum higginsianum (strain IMI 349063) TaxID=759273 RepID=H1VLB2_COLHI|nr:FAD binding domain-containing protein [Colletotrichum higginsianum IMI 349063]OBR11557.1 FAD binding domain-containing protein [Colletotrichum higginsianum IMI 349063]CCF41015.1 FAD binding domain-containing protein [Colletotrichum higginsianum]